MLLSGQTSFVYLLASFYQTTSKIGLIECDLRVVALEILEMMSQDAFARQSLIYRSTALGCRLFNMTGELWMATMEVAHSADVEYSIAVNHSHSSHHNKSNLCHQNHPGALNEISRDNYH